MVIYSALRPREAAQTGMLEAIREVAPGKVTDSG